MPWACSYDFTDAARASDNFRLCSGVPALSVWPPISALKPGAWVNSARASASAPNPAAACGPVGERCVHVAGALGHPHGVAGMAGGDVGEVVMAGRVNLHMAAA